MWDKLYTILKGVGIDLETQCKVYSKEDDSGKATSVTVFIPWNLAHLIAVADVQAALPSGWNASQSPRDVDMREALTSKVDYTPSIVIQQGANALSALKAFTSK